VLALLLGPLLLLLAKGSIDAALRDQAAAALTGRGVTGVAVSSDWAAVTLTGPGSAKDAALAAVSGMADRSAVDTVSYVEAAPGLSGNASATPSPASPATSTSPSSSATVVTPLAVQATVSGTTDPRTIVLSGTVQTEAQHQVLVDAATAAYGAGNLDDKITVSGTTSGGAPADTAVAQLAAVLTAFAPAVATGSAELADTTLTVTATAKDAAAAAAANAALDRAKGAGLTVTGTVQPPAASTGPTAPTGLTGQQAGARLAKILAVRGVTFDTGSATLTPAGAAILDQVAAVLTQAPAVKIQVAGHTDNQGTAASNQTLSAARAATVTAYLVAHHIPAGRISTAAFGATRPIASNDTPAGRSANRRIDLTVVGS
jgi:OOP family OmpA-OmpF porin